MNRYIQFLFAGIFRKKSIYICATIFVLLSSVFIYLGIAEANDKNVSGVKSVSGFTAWMPFVVSTIFNSIVVIHCFKSAENDGTDLIISSKPITRMQQIISKFIVVWIMSLIFGVFNFLSMIPICFVDKYATNEQIFRFSASIALGLIIIGFIVISITIIISSIMNKIGIMIVSLLLSAVPPILSFSIVPSANADNYLEDANDYETNGNTSFRLLKNINVGEVFDIYKEPQKTNFGQPIFSQANNKNILKNRDTWYRYAVYGDLWYQWNPLFSLTTKGKGQKFGYDTSYIGLKKIGNFNDVIKDKSKIKNGPIDQNNLYFAPSNYEYNLLFAKNLDVYKEKINAFIDLVKNNINISTLGEFKTRIKIEMLKIRNSSDYKDDIKKIQMGWISFRIIKYIQHLITDKLKDFPNPYNRNSIAFQEIINLFVRENPSIRHRNQFITTFKENENINFNNLILYRYERQDYLDKNIVIIIWPIIAIILIGLSISIYAKRDFK